MLDDSGTHMPMSMSMSRSAYLRASISVYPYLSVCTVVHIKIPSSLKNFALTVAFLEGRSTLPTIFAEIVFLIWLLASFRCTECLLQVTHYLVSE